MSRLIDADAFEKYIKEKYKDGESTDDIKDQMLFDLSCQPTAYDVEKVVKQFESVKTLHKELSTSEKLSSGDKHNHTLLHGLCVKVIDIVRSGGKQK